MKYSTLSPLSMPSRRILFQVAAGLLSLHLGLTVASSAQAQTGLCFDEFPSLPVILVSNGPDRLYATNRSARICGLAGNDEISAATPQVAPHLTINATDGAPGSIFTISGVGFNPGETSRLVLNGEPWTTLQVDADGGFALLVDTKAAAPDIYLITASFYQQMSDEMPMALEPAAAKFVLNPLGETQVAQTVNGVAAEATYRLSLRQFSYLPLVQQSQE